MKVGLSISGLDQLKSLRKKIAQFPVAADTAGERHPTLCFNFSGQLPSLKRHSQHLCND